ncbi:glycine cleavage system aminomethyltransferase GcvT [Hyperthermus butylicus]|uniref:aminomethyltransferase n=1 Tax=Hyperthermus butylicus (strain DSM 5456 / JCM 9403 / PLM1-5) TaxID=415426 RepID=A2BL20_HYPBU|nr:glycine cleavage system aminomethyltransferase GcvT [Hyperthermus butylicus]ABM80681.1 Aminomethyltransferase [Hyperthermus butylicus DSM 5456]
MTGVKVPLYDVHRELGASLGEFAGWLVPIDYGSIVEEHVAVRKTVGFFDLSHMARIIVSGPDAGKLLDKLVPRYLESEPGTMLGPTAFLNENAGFVDDVMLYNLGGNQWMIVANAVNREKVLGWLNDWLSRLGFTASVEDKTLELAMFAVQGPKAAELMERLGAPREVLELKLLRFRLNVELSEAKARAFLVSRSGWTGEDGFEIIAPVGEAEKILRKAAEIVRELGGRLCGLGARDSLRMEMGFVLYGHEIDEETTPVDARYWWVYQPGPKEDCVGCKALREALRRGAVKVRVGIRLSKKARIVPRQGDKIYVEGVEVGHVTSGAYSPVLGRSIAQAYIKPSHALMGLTVEVERRGKRYQGKIVDFPLVKPTSSPPL